MISTRSRELYKKNSVRLWSPPSLVPGSISMLSPLLHRHSVSGAVTRRQCYVPFGLEEFLDVIESLSYFPALILQIDSSTLLSTRT